MSKFRKSISALVIGLILASAVLVYAGSWTTNQYIYKPALGAKGETEKGWFDSGMDLVDAALGRRKTLGDPGYATLSAALTTIGSNNVTLCIPAGTISVTGNTTIPANVCLEILKGGKFDVSDGVTLTINGPMHAGRYQIFETNTSGVVAFGSGVSDFNYPEWWGAIVDDSGDDSAAVNKAIASQLGETRFGSGKYLVNAIIDVAFWNIRGVGSACNDDGGTVRNPVTILESYTESGWIFEFQTPTYVKVGAQYQYIRDIYFRGQTGSTRTSGGIIFGPASWSDPDDHLAATMGRWEILNCQFRNFDKCLYKPQGQIGLSVKGSYFLSSNYHYYVDRTGGTGAADNVHNWHGGCDFFYYCWFHSAYKAAWYLDCDQTTGGGQVVMHGGDFESNIGFGIFIHKYTNKSSPGIRLESVWFEDNVQGATVTDEAVGTGDGSTKVFDLDNKGVKKWSLVASVNSTPTAVILRKGTGSGGVDQIEFGTAPAGSATITASYRYSQITMPDASTYEGMDIFARDTDNFQIVNSPLANIKLVNAKVFAWGMPNWEQYATGAPYGYDYYEIDSQSMLFVDGAIVKTSTADPASGFYASTVHSISSSAPYGAAVKTKPRSKVGHEGNLLTAVPFNNASTFQWDVATGGGGPYTGNLRADGRTLDGCCEILVPDGKGIYPNGGSGTSSGGSPGTYVVWSVDLKQISGGQVKFFINNVTYNSFDAHFIIPTRWTTFAGIALKSASESVGLNLINSSGSDGTIRASALQIHEFSTYEEAVAFLDSGVYNPGTKNNRVVYGVSAPSQGTWQDGDICWNVGYVGNGYPLGWSYTGSSWVPMMSQHVKQTITYSSSITPNMVNGTIVYVDLSTNTAMTINAPSTLTANEVYRFDLKNGTGACTITWNSYYKTSFASNQQTITADKRVVVSFYYDGSNMIQIGTPAEITP